MRPRPILMTSLAFAFGVLPMMLSHGAGAEMRAAIGTAVFYGDLGVTLFGLVLTPVSFLVLRAMVERYWRRAATAAPPAHGGRESGPKP